jgi:hypothetical protein
MLTQSFSGKNSLNKLGIYKRCLATEKFSEEQGSSEDII